MKKLLMSIMFFVSFCLTTSLYACPQNNYGIYFVNDKTETIWVEIRGYLFNNSFQTTLLSNPLQQILPNSSFEFCFTQYYQRYQLKQAQPITNIMAYDLRSEVFVNRHNFLYILATDSNFKSKVNPPGTIIRSL